MYLLLAEAEYPDPPLDLQIHLGWLSLLLLGLMVMWAWTRAEPLRRALFAREDPRMFGIFRIGLGLFTFQNFWNLRMHWHMLWTDEGLFTGPEVRQRLGRTALKGWSEVDGFFDGWAVLQHFWGKHSLLFIESSPDFTTLYLAVFFGLLLLFTLGFRTRVTTVLLFLLMCSLYNRNAVYLEGTDTVYKNMWFFAIFARLDEAFSIDNWLRRKRERRLAAKLGGGRGSPDASAPAVPYDWGHFFDRAGHWLWGGLWAGWFCSVVDFSPMRVIQVVALGITISLLVGLVERSHRQGLSEQGKLELGEPVRFRLIPAWPRYLFILQLVCIYSATGLYKTGPVWMAGDALYYALNMDHFYRFEVVTQWMSVYLGTNVFRLMTWVTLFWEKLFALVLVGLILRFREQNRDQPWFIAHESVKWRKVLGGVSLIAAYGVLYRIASLAVPWCLALQKDKSPTPAEPALQTLAVLMLGVIPAIVVIWHLLRRWPLPVGRPFGWLLGKLPGERFAGLAERVGSAQIDQPFMRKWVFGRRIWIGIGFFFHFMLLTTMNIGMFPVIMIWMYPPYFESRPFLVVLRWTASGLRRRKWTAWMAPASLDDALSERPEVLETAEAAVRRDPTGPWFLDPHRLVVGAISWLRAPKPASLVRAHERGRQRGGRLPDTLVLALCAVGFVLATMRGLEAKQGPEAEGPKQAEFVGVSARDRRVKASEKQLEAQARRERIDRLGDFGRWWVYVGLGFAAVAHFRRRPEGDLLPEEGEAEAAAKADATETKPRPELYEPALMGGTLARTLAIGFFLYHSSAVACLFIPRYDVTKAWRAETQKVYGDWIRAMNQQQSWKMFAPNPPRRNTFMRTIVVDTDGESYQVGKDHYTNRPYVFWYNDRERKMQRRMVGKSKWYLKYWSSYQCRLWAMSHDGQLPERVEIIKMRTGIPEPDELFKTRKASDPRKRKLNKELLETHKCKDENLSPEFKQRMGWELSEEEIRSMEREAEKTAKSAEVARQNWAKRKDWGGPDEEVVAQLEAEAEANRANNKARIQAQPVQREGAAPEGRVK